MFEQCILTRCREPIKGNDLIALDAGLTRSLPFQPLSRTTGRGGERAARGGEGHVVNGLKSALRQRFERRAQDRARNVRPSRAANNDPHLDPLPERARDLEMDREWKKDGLKWQRASCTKLS